MSTAPTARELAGRAELLVRKAEHALVAAADPTGRDILETELRAVMELQDQVMEAVAPELERERREVRRRALAALDPRSDWELRHRRFLSPAVKSLLISVMGPTVRAATMVRCAGE